MRARAQRRVFEREELTVLFTGLALTLIGIALIFSAVTGSPFVSVANHHLRQHQLQAPSKPFSNPLNQHHRNYHHVQVHRCDPLVKAVLNQ